MFLLFQDLDSARSMMKYLDPNLGRPLPEKSYAENCELTVENLWVSNTRRVVPRGFSPSLTHAAEERARYILHRTRAGLVRQGVDPARLLVLLGMFFFLPCPGCALRPRSDAPPARF